MRTTIPAPSRRVREAGVSVGLFPGWLRQAAAPKSDGRVRAESCIRDGNALLAQGRLEEAARSYRDALSADGTNANACINLGFVFNELGRPAEAREQLERAVRLEPRSADAHYLLGLTAESLGDATAAGRHLAEATEIKPDFAYAWRDLSRVRFHAGETGEAIRAAERGLAVDGQMAELHNFLGNIHLHEGAFEQALACYDKTLSIAPGFFQAYGNKGLALHNLGCFAEALDSYEQALRLNPDFSEATHGASQTRLLLGDFRLGWAQYESRWQHKERKGNQEFRMALRAYAQPQWRGGGNLQGKAVLLYAEQGLGDTIQFCRYAKRVAALGARVILEAPPALALLLEDLEGVGQLVRSGDELPEFDCHCPLLSLPLAFRTDLHDISGAPYLQARPEKAAAWKERVGERRQPRVGLVWSGGTAHRNDRNRSIPLAQFREVLVEGIDYVCLQQEIRPADRVALKRLPEIRTFDAELKDFADTAALIEQVDLVIAVDTSVAHLAGALGKEVWILLPHIPDWRWLLDREDSPWYDSASLFRQPASGDWRSVLNAVGDKLRSRR